MLSKIYSTSLRMLSLYWPNSIMAPCISLFSDLLPLFIPSSSSNSLLGTIHKQVISKIDIE